MQVQEHDLAATLEQHLVSRFGTMIGREDLRRELGYSTADAFRQAVAKGTVPVRVFRIPHRRGWFALCADVARWLASLRNASPIQVADFDESAA